ncbi:MAG: hypothetical protein ACI9O6_000783 [Glaciecola sp.]|jgi:hypothetical protein
MPITIKATLINNNDKKPIANTSVALFFYQHIRGRVRPVQVAKGKTNVKGQASFTSSTEVGGFLPRVLLKAIVNNKWQNLTALPKTYTAALIDFGSVNINTVQAVSVGSMRFFGMANMTAAKPAAAVDTNKIKLIENEKTALALQLKTVNEEKAKHLAELNLKKKEVEKVQTEKKAQQEKNKTLAERLAASEALKETQRKELLSVRADLAGLKGNATIKPGIESLAPGKNPKLATTSMKAEAVYMQAVKAVNKADEKGESEGRFRISDVKMTLKVLSGEKEDEVRLIKNANEFKVIQPEMLSVIEFNLADRGNARPSAGEVNDAPVSRMPKLTGYTESMALRKLSEIGLRASVYQQQLSQEQIEKQPSLAGQVITQHPASGKNVTNPNDISLIIGVFSGES